jgi:hypothetical protein
VQSRWAWVHPALAVALASASLKCFAWYAALHWPLVKSPVHNRPLWVLDELHIASILLAHASLIWSVVAIWRGPRLAGIFALALSVMACLAAPVTM